MRANLALAANLSSKMLANGLQVLSLPIIKLELSQSGHAVFNVDSCCANVLPSSKVHTGIKAVSAAKVPSCPTSSNGTGQNIVIRQLEIGYDLMPQLSKVSDWH